jgi:hypothetical protein
VNADGTFIVSGSAATITVGGNLLANAGDNSRVSDTGESNDSTLIFEILDGGGVSLISVLGIADLTGAVIDVDDFSGTLTMGDTFDLIAATDVSEDFMQASEDQGIFTLGVFNESGRDVLRATVIPEPTTALAGLVGGIGLLLRRRRA